MAKKSIPKNLIPVIPLVDWEFYNLSRVSGGWGNPLVGNESKDDDVFYMKMWDITNFINFLLKGIPVAAFNNDLKIYEIPDNILKTLKFAVASLYDYSLTSRELDDVIKFEVKKDAGGTTTDIGIWDPETLWDMLPPSTKAFLTASNLLEIKIEDIEWLPETFIEFSPDWYVQYSNLKASIVSFTPAAGVKSNNVQKAIEEIANLLSSFITGIEDPVVNDQIFTNEINTDIAGMPSNDVRVGMPFDFVISNQVDFVVPSSAGSNLIQFAEKFTKLLFNFSLNLFFKTNQISANGTFQIVWSRWNESNQNYDEIRVWEFNVTTNAGIGVNDFFSDTLDEIKADANDTTKIGPNDIWEFYFVNKTPGATWTFFAPQTPLNEGAKNRAQIIVVQIFKDDLLASYEKIINKTPIIRIDGTADDIKFPTEKATADLINLKTNLINENDLEATFKLSNGNGLLIEKDRNFISLENSKIQLGAGEDYVFAWNKTNSTPLIPNRPEALTNKEYVDKIKERKVLFSGAATGTPFPIPLNEDFRNFDKIEIYIKTSEMEGNRNLWYSLSFDSIIFYNESMNHLGAFDIAEFGGDVQIIAYATNEFTILIDETAGLTLQHIFVIGKNRI